MPLLAAGCASNDPHTDTAALLPINASLEWPKDDHVLEAGTGLVKYSIDGRKSPPCRIVLDNAGLATDPDHTTTLEGLNGGKPLAEGAHILAVFPVDASGTSLEGKGAFRGRLPDDKREQVIANFPEGVYDAAQGEAHNVVCDVYLRAVDMETDRRPKYLNVIPSGASVVQSATFTGYRGRKAEAKTGGRTTSETTLRFPTSWTGHMQSNAPYGAGGETYHCYMKRFVPPRLR